MNLATPLFTQLYADEIIAAFRAVLWPPLIRLRRF